VVRWCRLLVRRHRSGGLRANGRKIYAACSDDGVTGLPGPTLTTPKSADDWSNQNGGRMLPLMPTPLGTTLVADERPPVAVAATASVYTGASHKTVATVADVFSECNTRAVVVVVPHALSLHIASHTVSHRRVVETPYSVREVSFIEYLYSRRSVVSAAYHS